MDVAGLVSSIITFVDFSWTIVRGTYDIHSSTSGATEENVHIGNVLQDLRTVTEKMRTDISRHGEHERALLDLEHQCRGLSSNLAAILQKLTVKRRSGLQSLNVTLRSLMKEKEVHQIQERLTEYRQQMILRLNLILLESSAAVQNGLQTRQNVEPSQLYDLKQKAEALTSDNSILRRLYFDEMYKRADNISDATSGTFDWLLEEQDASSNRNTLDQASRKEAAFRPLHKESERQERQENAAKISRFLEHGSGVFFLRGKPGSGKSTLMKYLIEGGGKQEVDRKLRKWAGPKRLIRVSAMFLLHGTRLQRSLDGFYRTLLFELLCQCPDLGSVLFSTKSKQDVYSNSYTSAFRLETLAQAWQRLRSIKDHDKIRICVSIDGMDEIEGTSGVRFQFARMLKEWAESDDIKIICSGRPNAEFNVVFDQPRQMIDLQNLTRADIRKILEERFQGVRHLSDLTRENTDELVSDISNQSEGVILWAVLVGNSIEDDMIHGKSLNTMKRTIQALPSGIEELFNNMLKGFPRDAQQHHIFRTICRLLDLDDQAPLALPLFWLEDALFDNEFPYNRAMDILPIPELNFRLDKVRGQLAQYTRHFVEIGNSSPNDDERHLHAEYRFIHRSAKEYIQSKFNFVGTAQQRLDPDMLDLKLRLRLVFEMSVERKSPTMGIVDFFKISVDCPDPEQTHRDDPFHQLNPRLMQKLQELLEARRGLLNGDLTNNRISDDRWLEMDLSSYGIGCGLSEFNAAVSLFHLALAGHQVDYVKELLQEENRQMGREDLRLGLLICTAGMNPSYELVNLLVDHGADPGCLVEVYSTRNQCTPTTPELTPLWLLFCFKLAFKASGRYNSGSMTGADLHISLYHEFLILERFLHLGYGSSVKFLAAPGINDIVLGSKEFEPDERDLFGMDLAQFIRFAKPDNMDRLLLLLESPSATVFSLAQKWTTFVLQPQFPFRTLPQGATTRPYRRVSDEYIRREGWNVWAAFDGEHEIAKGVLYYVPGGGFKF